MEYDVVVVGAGPSGSTLAGRLSENGLNVLLIDKSVGEKACAGILTTGFIRKYKVPEDLVEKELGGVKIGSRSMQITIERDRFPELSINRSKFDRFLLSKAIDDGTTFLQSEFISFERKNKEIYSRIGRDEVKSKILVAADGADSRVVKHARLGEIKLASCLQYEIENRGENFFEIFYGFTKDGYAWVSPKSESILVGIGSSSDSDLEGRLANFMKDNRIEGRLDGKVIKKEKGMIPVSGPIKKTCTDNILAVGDAGGFVTPYEGEGIYYAVRSSEIASGIAIQAFDSEDFSKHILSRYEVSWKKEFGHIFTFLSYMPLLINNDCLLDSFLKKMDEEEEFKNIIAKILVKDNLSYREYIKGFTSTLKILGDYYGHKYFR